jgi:hypothetical protein
MFGSKTSDAVVAELETGSPTRGTFYKNINSRGDTVGHSWVCTCSTEYPGIIGADIFAW